MINLSDRKVLAAIDKSNALTSIEQLPMQIHQAWSEASEILLPESYKDVEHIVVCGMGASWLGAHIINTLYEDRLRVPLIVVHDYHLPKFVGPKSLVICSSYSGTTEESIEATEDAYRRKAKLLTISTGGNLHAFALDHSLPHYTFKPMHNPAKAPRLGVGYSLASQMALFTTIGLLDVSEKEMTDCLTLLQTRVRELRPEGDDQQAKLTAREILGYIPVVVSGTFLFGVAHACSNQFNETSKNFGTYMHVPELNHHNLEGLQHPEAVNKLKYLFLESNLYDPRVFKRIQVTKDVISKNQVSSISYIVHGNTRLEQALDMFLFGSFVTFYLAMLYRVDPSPNPWVDYFKAQLAKK